MANISTPRSTAQYGGTPFGVLPETYVLGVAASTTISQGTMVAVNASGYAIPATAATGNVVGRCEAGNGGVSVIVNTGSAGSVSVTVRQGCFFWDSSGLTIANFGAVVFATDNHTVAASGTDVAGVFAGFDNITGTQAMVLTVLGQRLS